MAPRSPIWDNVNPDLARTVQALADVYEPYEVQYNSGYRPNSSRKGSEHRKGNAIDISLIDRKTGEKLSNIRDPSTAGAYQQFANDWYQSLSPELQAQARWGGYFKQGVPRDWMHLDLGGAERMAAGNWQQGFNPEEVKAMGLASAGGIGGAPARVLDPAAAAGGVPMDVPQTTPKGPVEAAGGGAGSEATNTVNPYAPPAKKKDEKKPWYDFIGEGIGGLGGSGGSGLKNYVPDTPAAARVDAPVSPIVDMNAQNNQRQLLAMAMARLNSGKLF